MSFHLAILKKPYLDLILTGQKKLECRLTKTAKPPFDRITPDQMVYLKESSGPVRGQAIVEKVKFFRDLSPDKINSLCQDYNRQIMASDDFWLSRQDCSYCSLIWLKNIRKCTPFRVRTKGMQAWLVLNEKDIYASKIQIT